MKPWFLGALIVAIAVSFAPVNVEAKRLGVGKSSGMQRNSLPASPQKTTPPAQQQAPAQQAAPGTPGAATAAAPKRSWMGPIAGLAAGLGLAALMSHLGMGEAFGNFLMLALLGVGLALLVAFLMRRFNAAKNNPVVKMGGLTPAWQEATLGSGASTTSLDKWKQPASFTTNPNAAFTSYRSSEAVPFSASFAAGPHPSIPTGFDTAEFERLAKMIFIRLQAANDTADVNDLRQFTTPEMFAALKMDLHDRKSQQQHTDVAQVDAQVLSVEQEGDLQVVSVRFKGEVRDSLEAPLESFDEIWHLTKPLANARNWAIAGIQQTS